MALGEPIDNRRDKARGEQWRTTDPDFSRSRVGKKLDVFDGLTQAIENNAAAIKQCAAVCGRLHASRMTIEQAHADRMLQFSYRSRNVGLTGVQAFRRP